MMKKKTVRLISCVIAGILIVAMLFSMFASSLTLQRLQKMIRMRIPFAISSVRWRNRRRRCRRRSQN